MTINPISALYAAALHMEKSAEDARNIADVLTSGARSARRAYEAASLFTDEPRCGATIPEGFGPKYGPCARPADHPEEYCTNASQTQIFRRPKPDCTAEAKAV